MAVHISGTVLASLFYDHSVSICDQIGFLVGDVVSHVRDTISDSQMNSSEVETRIYVYDSIPCTADRRVFNSKGDILETPILDLLKGKHKSIVGWYSFRRGSTMRPSFRERLIHQNLSLCVSGDHPADFIFMLCTSKYSTNFSTHSFDHGFLKLSADNVFKKVPMTVVNLEDTTHTEYRQMPSHTVSNTTGVYSSIVKQHEQDFLNAQGQVEINRITALSNTLHRQLERISKEVDKSEKELAQLEDEVQKHRKEVKYKQLEKKQRESSFAAAATSFTNQKSVITEEMEHSDLHKPKQPSIDEILSMEDIESVTVNTTSTFDLSDTGILSDSPKPSPEMTDNHMDTSHSSSESDIQQSKNKKEIKLTAAVSLHDKIDRKETDGVLMSKSDGAELITSKGASGAGSAGQKTSDPFSFVSNIMQDTKMGEKSNVRSRSTMEVPKGAEIKNPVTRHTGQTEDVVPQEKHVKVTRKKSDRESAAVLAAASAISTQGERSRSTRSQTKVQGQKDKTNKQESELSDESDKKKARSRISDTAKHCSQEAEEEKSQNSQDTYEMDGSSSPVY